MSTLAMQRMRAAWRSPAARATRWGVGVAGVATAAAFAVGGVDWDAVRSAAGWPWAVMAAGVGVNLLATAAVFQLVTRGFGPEPPVPWVVMTRLIAASALLNYVPVVRLGLWTRAAYLKARHGVAIRGSAASLAVVLAVSLAVVLAAAAVLRLAEDVPAWGWGGLLWVAAGAALVTQLIARRTAGPGDRWQAARPWAWPVLRLVDVAASGLRLWAALAVVGVDVHLHEAVLLGCAGTLGRLAAVTPNGLGLSEWLVALVGASRVASGEAIPLEAVAAAALIDRGVEVVVLLAAGGWGLGVYRRGGVTPDPPAA